MKNVPTSPWSDYKILAAVQGGQHVPVPAEVEKQLNSAFGLGSEADNLEREIAEAEEAIKKLRKLKKQLK